MKRIASVLLAIVMTISMLAVPVNAATETEEPLARILTLSDYQKWTSNWTDDWETLQTQLTGLVNGAYEAGMDPDYMFFGGDYSCLDSVELSSTGMSQVNSIIRSKWSNLTDDKMVNVQGNHDPAGTPGLTPTGPVEFEDFLVYVIREDDYPSKQGESSVRAIVENTVKDLNSWLQEKIEEGETRPIFLATHTGLHYDIDRTDGNNQYAYLLFEALNEAAKKLDIVFLFGHNHTNGDELVGGSLTCLQKGDKLDVCTETSIADRAGTTSVLNFTYMNYGYIGYIGDIYNNQTTIEPTDILTISELWLYEDRIEVYRYSYGGLVEQYTATLDRDFTEKTEFGAEYTLTYNSNGGTEIASYKTIQSWSTVSRTMPVNGDKEFLYWSTNEDGSGNRYQPGDSIYIADDTTLYAQYEEVSVEKYNLVETLTPGKEYLLVWNSEYYTNNGTKYALSDASSNVTAIDSKWISADGSTIEVPMNANNSVMRWDCTYNTGYNPGEGYMLQNISTKNFLTYTGSNISCAADPTSDWEAYFWSYVTDVSGESGNLVDNLVPYSNDGAFIRYSVSGGKLKMGSRSSSTDPRNSTVYLYEKEASTEKIWEKVEQLNSNEEYLIVSGNEPGAATAMTVTQRTIGEKSVEIRKDESGQLYIEYDAPYNDNAVVHSYQVRANEFWLSTWNNPKFVYDSSLSTQGEVIYLYPTDGAIKITGNHFDDRYYTRFNYAEGVLTAYKGVTGTGTRSTLVYNNKFTIDSGEDVSVFKRVQAAWGGSAAEEHEHVFGEYVSDENATCYTDGTQSAACACGVVDTQPLKDSKTEHNYVHSDGKVKCELCGREHEIQDSLPYKDVSEDSWYYAAVYDNYFAGLMTGKTDTEFAPAEALTRAQFALILYRIEGAPEVDSDKVFDDVSVDSWYTDAVLWAYEEGIITGYANTNKFGPHDNIMREQMAVMMYRYAQYKNLDVEADTDLGAFSDAEKVGDYAVEAMQWAVGAGIITGKDEVTLAPRGSAIRAEAAVVIDRFMDTYNI